MSEWFDFDLQCRVDFSGGDWSIAASAIGDFEPVCGAEADYLLYTAQFVEWTGNYSDAYYEWNAWYWNGTIGIQWPYVGDWYLLAHEGAHGLGMNEYDAHVRGLQCTSFLY